MEAKELEPVVLTDEECGFIVHGLDLLIKHTLGRNDVGNDWKIQRGAMLLGIKRRLDALGYSED